MALIKCPECGKEISNQSKVCIHCGYTLQSQKSNVSNKSSLVTKGIIAGLIILVVVLVTCIFITKNSPINKVMDIIKKDCSGENVTFDKIYYREEDNTYIICFTRDYSEDIAMISLDDKEIGYRSVYQYLCDRAENATGDKQQQYALTAVEYIYDPLCVYSVLYSGNDSWELVYRR